MKAYKLLRNILKRQETCSHLFSMSAWLPDPPRITISLSDITTYSDGERLDILFERKTALTMIKGEDWHDNNVDLRIY